MGVDVMISFFISLNKLTHSQFEPQEIIAGDASYHQDNMLKGIPDGVGNGEAAETLRKIREFTTLYPTVCLPSHDPESARRMDEQIIVPRFQEEVQPV